MTHISPASKDSLEDFEDAFKMIESAMGFVPTSLKVMARRPALLQAFMGLSMTIMGPASILPAELRQMIAHVASKAAGCNYCQAHTGEQVHRSGASDEKIAALWSFETSDLFTDAERAALSLAQAGGSVPNQASEAHFDLLKAHFSEDEIVGIVSVIALFGFLNRWNDTLATTLEDSPLAFAQAQLSGLGWKAGKHG